MRTNILTAYYKEGELNVIGSLYQYDYGQRIVFADLTLPTAYEVHFSNEERGESYIMIGDSTGVDIPDELLQTGKNVYVWIYLHTGENDGETVYRYIINVRRRAEPIHDTPTPVQQNEIEQAISALSVGVSEVESIAEGIPQTINEALQEAKDSGEFDGFSPVVTITEITGGHEVTITDAEGDHEFDVLDGHSPVVTASKSGKVTTVSVDGSPIATINDGTDGQDGEKGDTGATPALTIGTVETLEPSEDATVTITGTTDAPVLNFGIPQGEQGDATIDDTKGIGDTDFVWSADKDAKELDKKSPVITEEIGESVIAQFTDGADGMPMEMTVEIEPVQGLNGQANPYPPGGGKNLLNNTATTQTIGTVTFTVSSDGIVSTSGTASDTYVLSFGDITLNGGSSYIFSGLPSNGSNTTFGFQFYRSGVGSDNFYNATGNTINVETTTTYAVRLVIRSGQNTNGLVFKPMICLSTATDPTVYAPYKNICPISGWTGAEIWDDPAYGGLITWNQLANVYRTEKSATGDGVTITDNRDGSYTFSTDRGGATANKYNSFTLSKPVVKDHVYLYYSGMPFSGNVTRSYVVATNIVTGEKSCNKGAIFYGGENALINIVPVYIPSGTTITTPKTIYPQLFDLTLMFGSNVANYIYSLTADEAIAWFRNLFPKDYYPYNTGETTTVSAVNGDPYRHIEITFPSEAGTVYGGTLTVNKDGTGTLVVDWKNLVFSSMSDFTGVNNSGQSQTTGNYWASPYISLSNAEKAYAATPENGDGYGKFDKGRWINSAQGSELRAYAPSDRNRIYVVIQSKTYDLTTSNGRDAYMTEIGSLQVAYKLATPVTYQLPAPIIRSMLGTNNIFCDTGDVLSVNYAADTKLFIEKKIAELQALILENIGNT